jgi:hypothetical protein
VRRSKRNATSFGRHLPTSKEHTKSSKAHISDPPPRCLVECFVLKSFFFFLCATATTGGGRRRPRTGRTGRGRPTASGERQKRRRAAVTPASPCPSRPGTAERSPCQSVSCIAVKSLSIPSKHQCPDFPRNLGAAAAFLTASSHSNLGAASYTGATQGGRSESFVTHPGSVFVGSVDPPPPPPAPLPLHVCPF